MHTYILIHIEQPHRYPDTTDLVGTPSVASTGVSWFHLLASLHLSVDHTSDIYGQYLTTKPPSISSLLPIPDIPVSPPFYRIYSGPLITRDVSNSPTFQAVLRLLSARIPVSLLNAPSRVLPSTATPELLPHHHRLRTSMRSSPLEPSLEFYRHKRKKRELLLYRIKLLDSHSACYW